jgi:hypothetical protein
MRNATCLNGCRSTPPAIGETGGPRRRRPRRLSEVFAELARQSERAVSIGSIRDALGDRSFAALLVFFAFPNILPLPPGVTTLLGLPLVLVSAQMIYGRSDAWLPEIVTRRSIPAETFRSIMERLIPRLIRVERMIRPRYWPFWRRHGDRVIGVIALILAIVITLPIPLGNGPPAFATVLLGLALSERDGILFAVGCAIALGSMAIVASVIGAVIAAANAIIHWLL